MAAHSPIIVGPNTKVLQDGGRVERPAFECDTCTARWKIKTALIDSGLIPKWGEVHPYPSRVKLRKVSHSFVEERGGWTILDATYKGVLGEMPRVREVNSQSIGSSQLERLGIDGGIELVPSVLNVQFYTPTTTFEYYTVKKPKGPIFRNRINWQDDSMQIIDRRGAGRNRDSVTLIAGASLAASLAKGGAQVAEGFKSVATSNGYNGTAEIVTGDYKAEPVAEGLWKCYERNEIQIFPYGFNRLLRLG